MGDPKSREATIELVAYLCHLIQDLYEALDSLELKWPGVSQISAARHDCPREVNYDIDYIRSRTQSEGMSFLTTTLPRLDKTLLKYLEAGVWEAPKGFKPYAEVIVNFDGRRKVFNVPCFLRHVWVALLTGTRFPQAPTEEYVGSITALGVLIQRARSVFLSCYKLELPNPLEKVMLAIDRFVTNEADLESFELPSDNSVLETAEHLIEDILDGFPLESSIKANLGLPLKYTPRHGPGAVAGGQRNDQKWEFSTLYRSLHQVFPYYDYMYGIRSNSRAVHLAARTAAYKNLVRAPYPVAKIVAVPKDSRGPRLISEEPLELQYMQQALARPLMHFLEDVSRVSAGQINFARQSVNAALALRSSLDRELATLDMRDASDRVSLTLVERLFSPTLVRAFKALRSHATLLPTGEELAFRKFAPMGSALCFPVESVVFYAISVSSLVVRHGMSRESASRCVWVYGDDIIVPSAYSAAVMEDLESVGLLVNRDKSFIRGHFRESCGTDAWLGQNVTPLRLRKLPCLGPSQGENVLAYCAYADSLYRLGCSNAERFIRQRLNRAVGWIPSTDSPVEYVSFVRPASPSELKEYPRRTWNADLQQWTSLLYCPRVKRERNTLTGWERLMRGLLQPARDSTPDWNTVRSAVSLRRKRVIVSAPEA